MIPTRLRNIVVLPVGLTLALFLLTPVSPVSAVDPCCSVKAMDPRTGMVTLQDLKTGETFQLKADRNQRKSLKVGDQVDRNLTVRQ